MTPTNPPRHPLAHSLTVCAADPKGLGSHSLMVMDMGQHVVQDIAQPVTLHQILVPGLEDRARAFPPLSTTRQLSPGTLPGALLCTSSSGVPAARGADMCCIPACRAPGLSAASVALGLLSCPQLSVLRSVVPRPVASCILPSSGLCAA